MFIHTSFLSRLGAVCLTCCCAYTGHAVAQSAETWRIVIGPEHAVEEATRVAVADLTAAFEDCGLTLSTAEAANGNAILVGSAARDVTPIDTPDDPEGYAIKTIDRDGARTILVSGGSVIGEVYGLYWILDRLRVYGAVPEINTVRTPAMKIRFGAAWGRHGGGGNSKDEMRAALRQSINWVSGPAVLDLVPWNAEPEATTNAVNRAQARELIDYAHSLHMKYFSFANEFTYHPSLMDDIGATSSPCDPKFWDAVQEKFRMLFTALPELDGIELCNDDISGFWEDYRAYDLMHETPECDWSYEKRFRTFVQKVHEVVADEFDKDYFHFTWSLTPHEVHTQPAVFREIFTDAVPTNNLYLIPKITTADRWWHQPYNPTFNLTPHPTLVCFETMNYYESGRAHIFPTFSGEYFQAGLQTFLMPENPNLVGAASLAGTNVDGWDTRSAHTYILYRLMWDPNESVEQIAEDFCAMNFGRDAANDMARIYLLTPSSYKYGLHIEPVSYGQFNSFIHMRVGTFPAEGYPAIDGGKEHLEFLRKIYLRCKPWQHETLDDLQHGLDTANEMQSIFDEAKPTIDKPALADDLANRLAMTRNLIRTNLGYVETMFAYFAYEENSREDNRVALASAIDRFRAARQDFIDTPGFGYELFGVDVLLRNAEALLANRDAALAALDRKPTRSQLDATIAEQQRRYKEVLEKHADKAVKFAHVEIMVDGRDILNIKRDTYEIEHLRWDYPHVRVFEFSEPLPAEPVTVIPRDIESRPMHPFVLEQPGPDNNFTARIYLDDLPGGQGWMTFDLYYISQAPEKLDLQIPWEN
ncbi:MAG: hypothetical protein KJ060_12915 [Candidatus Hydrogenedentes bacterium]|nr:hypothetical protein [Candidatus Hydrogenedentota bacterium]